MIYYTQGPPPEHLIQVKNGKYKVNPPLHTSMEIAFYQETPTGERYVPVDPFDCKPGQYWKIITKNKRYKSGDRLDLASLTKRSVTAILLLDRSEREPLIDRSWEFVFSPIQAWEAWEVCKKSDLLLQGVKLNVKDRVVRVYFADIEHETLKIEVHPSSRVTDSSKRKIDDLWSKTEEAICNYDDDLAREIMKLHRSLDESDPLEFLSAIQRIYDVGNQSKGWKVSGIWRYSKPIIEEQAARLGFGKTQYLFDKIESRRTTHERKLKEMAHRAKRRNY